MNKFNTVKDIGELEIVAYGEKLKAVYMPSELDGSGYIAVVAKSHRFGWCVYKVCEKNHRLLQVTGEATAYNWPSQARQVCCLWGLNQIEIEHVISYWQPPND